MFAEDEDNTLWTSGGGQVVGWLNTREFLETGDAVAMAALQRYTDRLARAISGVVNIMDPDIIVFGGGLSHLDIIYDVMPKALSQYVFSDVCETPIVKNMHGDSSGVRGAAWLWPKQAGGK